jgi:hypothetical protein
LDRKLLEVVFGTVVAFIGFTTIGVRTPPR